jgi:hypothetical protein
MGLPYETGLDERGNRRENPVKISFFEGENLNNFPANVRDRLRDTVAKFKEEKTQKQRSKLLAPEIEEIVDILRRS